MIRRLAKRTALSWLLTGATLGTVSAVEFVVSDNNTPTSPGAVKIPHEATTVPGTQPQKPKSSLTPIPDRLFASPADPATTAGVGVGAMPQNAGTTVLPEGAYDYEAVFAPSPMGSGSCDSGCACEACDAGDDEGGLFVDLWLAQGFTWNPDDPQNGFNTPVTFNDFANDYQLNQLYLSFGRQVRDSGFAWDAGARVDLLYGTDYFFTQATGLETRTDGSPRWNSGNGPRPGGAARYGLAMPQLFAEVYAPVLGGVNVKAGHFYTTIGYESVMAPENFFYSHAYTMQYGEPFTHTGIMTSMNLGPNTRWHFAVTRGWDTWEDPNNKPGYLFGFSWTPNDDASLSATVHTGREDANGNQDRTMYSIVYTRQLTGRLRYVLQHDFGMEANAEFDQNFNTDSAKWYGLNNYLFYDINCRLTAGMRLEWFRDQDNARVLGLPFEGRIDGGNYTELTLGLNWQATEHMVWRPELRWDWSDVDQLNLPGDGMFDDFSDRNQFTAAMDIIFEF